MHAFIKWLKIAKANKIMFFIDVFIHQRTHGHVINKLLNIFFVLQNCNNIKTIARFLHTDRM